MHPGTEAKAYRWVSTGITSTGCLEMGIGRPSRMLPRFSSHPFEVPLKAGCHTAMPSINKTTRRRDWYNQVGLSREGSDDR
jgi:hypothetical protein